ncbi:MAG: acetylxylan esterase [Planctomycetia bacterium]|nr:acetylxylan esterase [Planctomycetia bacterium]
MPIVDQLPPRRELPNPLVMLDGTPVKTPDDWNRLRRPELKRLFQHYVYGYAPPPPEVTARVTKTVPDALNGQASLSEVEITLHIPGSGELPRILLALFVPRRSGGPWPLFLFLNECGNQSVVPDDGVTPHIPTPGVKPCGTRGSQADFWCVEQIVRRGYAVATFCQNDIAPDVPGSPHGVAARYPDLATPETRWGTLAAWAWGLSRAVDYLEKNPQIDSKHIAVIGHSRRGKAALLAGAMDERFWLVVPHQSGTGGSALSRDNHQETVGKITHAFPQWFNRVFPQFAGREDRLPVDQHLLAALVAPRALLDTAGTQDKWSSYESSLRGLHAADKVYKLLGASGLVGPGVVSGGEKFTAATCGNLAQYRRDAPHTLNKEYWEAILNFADLQRGQPAAK